MKINYFNQAGANGKYVFEQQKLFKNSVKHKTGSKFISTFRVSLVKDRCVSFEETYLNNSKQAQPLIRKLIETQGQPDREQFCIILLNIKNKIIGLNIVSTGCLTSAQVHPREVLKPAILSNCSSMILCHNHPSGNTTPSNEDLAITKKIVLASKIIGIQIHEHLIISMEDETYYSFADNGIMARIYDEID